MVPLNVPFACTSLTQLLPDELSSIGKADPAARQELCRLNLLDGVLDLLIRLGERVRTFASVEDGLKLKWPSAWELIEVFWPM